MQNSDKNLHAPGSHLSPVDERLNVAGCQTDECLAPLVCEMFEPKVTSFDFKLSVHVSDKPSVSVLCLPRQRHQLQDRNPSGSPETLEVPATLARLSSL